VMPLSTNTSDQTASLFTVGPRSASNRRELEADYEKELLNKGILVDEESFVDERHPEILNATKHLFNIKKKFRVKINNTQIALFAIIRENG